LSSDNGPFAAWRRAVLEIPVDRIERKIAIWKMALLIAGAQRLNAAVRERLTRRRRGRWVVKLMINVSSLLRRAANETYDAEIRRLRRR